MTLCPVILLNLVTSTSSFFCRLGGDFLCRSSCHIWVVLFLPFFHFFSPCLIALPETSTVVLKRTGVASLCGSLLSASSPTVSPQQSTTAVGCLFLAGLEARSQRVHIFYSQCSGPSLSSKGCLMTLDTLLFLCLPMDPGHPWEGYSLPPAALDLVLCPKFCPFFPKWLRAFFFPIEKG